MSAAPKTGDLTLAGFGLARRRPGVLIGLTLLYLLSLAGGAYAFFVLTGPDFAKLLQPAADGVEQTPPEVLHALQGVWMFEAAVILGALVIGSVGRCMVLRAVLRPEERAFASLRFGGDELRMMALLLMIWVIFGAAGLCLVSLFSGAALTFAAYNPWVGAAIGVFGLVATVVLIAWMAIRFSLAGASTVAERRISFGLEHTSGRGQALFGLGFRVFVITLAVSSIASLLLNPLLQGLMLEIARTGDPARALRAVAPFLALGGPAACILYALNTMVMWAPFAAAYARFTGPEGAPGAAAEAQAA